MFTPYAPTTARGEVLDDYMLALVIRLREAPEPAAQVTIEPQFILFESRALYDALGGQVPPELEAYLLRAKKHLPDVGRLTTRELLAEFEDTQLRIRHRLFDQQKDRIHSLGQNADELWGFTGQLAEVAQSMGAIDQQLPPKAGAA